LKRIKAKDRAGMFAVIPLGMEFSQRIPGLLRKQNGEQLLNFFLWLKQFLQLLPFAKEFMSLSSC